MVFKLGVSYLISGGRICFSPVYEIAEKSSMTNCSLEFSVFPGAVPDGVNTINSQVWTLLAPTYIKMLQTNIFLTPQTFSNRLDASITLFKRYKYNHNRQGRLKNISTPISMEIARSSLMCVQFFQWFSPPSTRKYWYWIYHMSVSVAKCCCIPLEPNKNCKTSNLIDTAWPQLASFSLRYSLCGATWAYCLFGVN